MRKTSQMQDVAVRIKAEEVKMVGVLNHTTCGYILVSQVISVSVPSTIYPNMYDLLVS